MKKKIRRTHALGWCGRIQYHGYTSDGLTFSPNNEISTCPSGLLFHASWKRAEAFMKCSGRTMLPFETDWRRLTPRDDIDAVDICTTAKMTCMLSDSGMGRRLWTCAAWATVDLLVRRWSTLLSRHYEYELAEGSKSGILTRQSRRKSSSR